MIETYEKIYGIKEEDGRYKYAVLISKFIIDDNFSGMALDVSLEKMMIDILNIVVIFEDGRFDFSLPENYCSAMNRDFPTIRFIDPIDWQYIKSELEKQLRSQKWVMTFFSEKDT